MENEKKKRLDAKEANKFSFDNGIFCQLIMANDMSFNNFGSALARRYLFMIRES
jgi:hypothetical protein